jgi:hypothetical protein
MHRMSNLNKFKDSIRNVLKTFFGPKVLPQKPDVLICIKCMNLTRIKMPNCNVKSFLKLDF